MAVYAAYSLHCGCTFGETDVLARAALAFNCCKSLRDRAVPGGRLNSFCSFEGSSALHMQCQTHLPLYEC